MIYSLTIGMMQPGKVTQDSQIKGHRKNQSGKFHQKNLPMIGRA